jgi:GNAT superfamily N-acetyltransferase
VAHQNGRHVGFLIASLDLGVTDRRAGYPSQASLGGGRWASIPIACQGAAGPDRVDVYREMYGFLAGRFVDNGCFLHSITLPVCDFEGIETWFGLGFGIDQVLGVRDLSPLTAPAAEVVVRRAGPNDLDGLLHLTTDLLRFHAATPVLRPFFLSPTPSKRTFEAALSQAGGGIWVAAREAELLGMMEVHGGGDHSFNNGRSTRDVTIGIASTAEAARFSGVGTAILAHLMEWAREKGYERITVGWTSPNLASNRFWRGRGFRPLHYQLSRQVDERVAWANERQSEADLLRQW